MGDQLSWCSILVLDPLDPPGTARWVLLLDWNGGQIAAIRDFVCADYVMEGAGVTVTAI